uniref:Uncharacterized protein n=1 Tax=Oryza meridionalis TaxID=40149 RepID=A0A0E0D9G1_9ORYZ
MSNNTTQRLSSDKAANNSTICLRAQGITISASLPCMFYQHNFNPYLIVIVVILLDASGSTLFANGQLHVPERSIDIDLALDGVASAPPPDHVPDSRAEILGPEAEGDLHGGDPLLLDRCRLGELGAGDAVVTEPHLIL